MKKTHLALRNAEEVGRRHNSRKPEKSQPDNPERLGPGNTRVPGPYSVEYARRQNETKTRKNEVGRTQTVVKTDNL